jgi:hypothetical protein
MERGRKPPLPLAEGWGEGYYPPDRAPNPDAKRPEKLAPPGPSISPARGTSVVIPIGTVATFSRRIDLPLPVGPPSRARRV